MSYAISNHHLTIDCYMTPITPKCLLFYYVAIFTIVLLFQLLIAWFMTGQSLFSFTVMHL